MAEADRLSDLQMGEAGHDGFRLAFGDIQQALLQPGQLCADLVDLGTQVEAQIGGHLIIARAAGVQFFAGDADALGQAGFYIHMDIFEFDQPGEGLLLDIGSDVQQAFFNGLAFFLGEYAYMGQHTGMGDGCLDIIAVQALVKSDGGAEAFHKAVGFLGEASAPGLVSRFFVCHVIYHHY